MKFHKIIYSDAAPNNKKANYPVGRILYSKKLDIRGKPDFVFKNKLTGSMVVVEIKSGYINGQMMPRQGDLMQLACYFAIIEEEFGRRVKGGKLVYKDYMFEVRNTARLRRRLKGTVWQMRRMLRTGRGKPKKNSKVCKWCVCNGTVCEFVKKRKKNGKR